MAETGSKGTGSKRPRPQAAKPAEAKAEGPGPIGVEPVIRVGGHVITDDGWTPEEEG
jgi:hypothetical protein